MNQIPAVPYNNPYLVQQQTTYMPIPQQQPHYNAVKIDIHNPSVGVPEMCPQPVQQAPTAQPALPYYTYPTSQVYNYPQAPTQPYYPPVTCPPCAPTVPQLPPAPISEPVATAPVTSTPVVTQAPVAPVTQPVQQQNINYPVPPATPVEVPVNQTAQVPAPVVTTAEAPKTQDAPAATNVDAKPEVVPAEAVDPQVDLNSFIAKLANSDFEVQASGMEDIATMIKSNPEKATELVDSKIFDALTNIVNYDSNALTGPTQEQLDAREKMMNEQQLTDAEKALATTITPKEQAERNKSYALFTTAMMQKLYADEVARLSNTTVPLTELPGASTVVDNLKDNPNPMVRASAIEALSYIQNPAYKKDLTTVFTIAQRDSDPGVAEAAKIALEKLNQV